MEDNFLNTFFSPNGIVVIGASQDPTKLGYALARNLAECGYMGVLHFVNPRRGVLFERSVYPSVAEVPDPVDLAILLIPASSVPRVLGECGERGIRAAIIASGGFREIGPSGAALEQECLKVARAYRMHLIGPNCVGVIDTHLPMNATFLAPPGPPAGDLALLSHSGAFCATVLDWAHGQGLGFSRLVSLGNQVDLTETDLLAETAADPHTNVVLLYLESIGDGRRFVQTVPLVTQKKPVVALKVGRSASGQRAAASHTGSLAGQDAAFDAAFRHCGVIRAASSEDLFDWSRVLAWCPVPQGPKTAILTNAGGPGVSAADALETHNLQLADFQAHTCTQLSALLPAAASINNPVDLLATATPGQYAACLRLLLADPGVDAVVVILVPPPLFEAYAILQEVIPLIKESAKPVVMVVMGETKIQAAVQLLRSERIPDYRFPERAVAALWALAQRGEYIRRPKLSPPIFEDTHQSHVANLLATNSASKNGWLPGETALAVVQAYGIQTPPQVLARTLSEALAAANRLGLGAGGQRIALKIASPDIPHKTDVEGVILNITRRKDLTNAFKAMLQRVQNTRPQAKILGVYLQPMVPPGQEVILGAVQDPQFGPLVLFGSGGVEVEGLKDVAFGLAPLTELEANTMIDATWAGRKLVGYRSLPAADRSAVLSALLRLAQLAADFPQLTEIEINPLRALAQGAYALDVRIRLAP